MKNKLAFTLFMSCFLIFNASAKQQNKSEKNISDVRKSETEINPEIEKLNRVLMQLSDECKAAIPNGNPQEFLQDLQAVLQSENDFSSEDLSPFYLIDKKHTVSSDYVPKNLVPLVKNDLYSLNRNDLSLRSDVEKALQVMAKAALEDGIKLLVSSTYRSYSYQEKLFARWVAIDGLEEAERESARPGTSQHQLGSAIDFGSITDDFDETTMGKWLYANASKYGWSLSFPKNYEDITGYRWECWHFRYIDVPACQMQRKWFGNVQQYMLEFIDLWKKY